MLALLSQGGVPALPGEAQEITPKPSTAAAEAKSYDDQVRPFLVRHCLECHGTEKPKGDLRLDRLIPDFASEASRERWLTVLERVKTGAMPPQSKPRPPEQEVRTLTDWISSRVEAAEVAQRAAEGRAVLRRLNRVEYENTVRDLLGVAVDLKELLPGDSAAHGFDNVGEALHVSSFLMERYLEAADTALNVAIANGPKPPMIQKRFRCQDERHVKTTTERVFRARDDALVLFSSSPWQAVTLGQFYPPDRGQYRFRISAYAVQSSGKPVVFRVDAGPMLMGAKNHLVNYFEVPADKPTVVEFVDHLEARNTLRFFPYYSGKEESHVERILIRWGSERIEIRSTIFVAGVIWAGLGPDRS